MDDTIFDTLDETQEPTEAPTRRVPWVLVVGVVPWLVVAVILLGPARPGPAVASGPAGPDPASPQVSGAVEAVDVPGDPSVAGGGAVAPALRAQVLAAPSPEVPSAATVGAVATVVARAHLTGVGPALPIDGVGPPPEDRYVEHIAVESVDHPGPGAAVASVLAVVLTVTDGGYEGLEVVRLAVPLVVDAAGVSPAGSPWRLPARDLGGRALTVGEPITDPVLLAEAAEALGAAGFGVDAVTSLTATASWPLVVTAEGTAPGQTTPATHVVWLRSHLGELVVAGARHREDPS